MIHRDTRIYVYAQGVVTAKASNSTINAHGDYLRRTYFTSLDGLRCFAILAVMWHHSVGKNPFESPLFGRGYLGVDLFFVLSGFLITTILIREKTRTGDISLKNFYARRSLRIFPLYYTYLFALTAWIGFTDRETFPEFLEVLPVYLTYMTNWIPHDQRLHFERGWSLAVEEQFYLVWPCLLYFIGFRWGVKLAAAFLVLVTISNCGLLGGFDMGLVPFRTLIFGSLLAMVLNSPSGYLAVHRILGHSTAIAFVGAMLVAILIVIPGPITQWFQLFVHALMVAIVACAVIRESNVLTRVLTCGAVKQIGVISYGIYLLHGQLHGVTMAILQRVPIASVSESRLAMFVVFTTISALVAFVSYYWFEAYFLKLKDRFVSSPTATPLPSHR
jgi:peptidoglycan/LPS O-acetylase OafA/YrhL